MGYIEVVPGMGFPNITLFRGRGGGGCDWVTFFVAGFARLYHNQLATLKWGFCCADISSKRPLRLQSGETLDLTGKEGADAG
jgi:hypothetical protein